MKTFAVIMGLVLSITTIAQAEEAQRPLRLNCKVAVDGNEAYLTVKGSSGVYRAPRMREVMDFMGRNPTLFNEMKTQREAGKLRTLLHGEAGWRWFYFNSQPSADKKSPRCSTRFANGYDCFDYMIKQGSTKGPNGQTTTWNLSEGINSEFWAFSNVDDVESLYSVARSMNCSNDFRLNASSDSAPAPERQESQEAPAPEARPAPTSSSASAPPPVRAAEILPAALVAPAAEAAVAVSGPRTRTSAPMTIVAVPPSAAAAAAPRAASN